MTGGGQNDEKQQEKLCVHGGAKAIDYAVPGGCRSWKNIEHQNGKASNGLAVNCLFQMLNICPEVDKLSP